jgi:CubicO group peptidase (beta-lactamase class C family)|tara:strand:- start:139 stop:1380 length:1242 start_codon:yes stop_codon:yes gene_type:complete
MKKILILSILILITISCQNPTQDENPIKKFQNNLVEKGITGSNVTQVFKDGKIIYSNIANSGALGDKDIDENTIFPIWSMSKTVTTVAMMILLDEGKYNLNDNVADYLPEYENINCKGPDGIYPCENELKIIHLLTHRSGYTYYANNGANWVSALHTDLYPAITNPVRFNNLDDYSKAVSEIPLDFEPGSMYTYGINHAILGRLIEVITNKSFYSYLKENIFDKLEMNDTKFHLTAADRKRFQPLRVNIKPNTAFNNSDFHLDGYTSALDGYTYDENNKAHFGGEGLVSTMSDFSKFCEMLVNGGVYNNERIVSEEGIKTMTSKYSNGYPDPSEPNVFPLEGYSYGFTFSVLEDSDARASGAPNGIYGWSGYHNTWFWIDPTNKLYALFMSNSIEPDFSILKDFELATYKFIN